MLLLTNLLFNITLCILPLQICTGKMPELSVFNSRRIPKLTWSHFFDLGHRLKAYIVNLMANYGQFTIFLGFVEYSQRIRYFTTTVAQSHYLILISTVLQWKTYIWTYLYHLEFLSYIWIILTNNLGMLYWVLKYYLSNNIHYIFNNLILKLYFFDQNFNKIKPPIGMLPVFKPMHIMGLFSSLLKGIHM